MVEAEERIQKDLLPSKLCLALHSIVQKKVLVESVKEVPEESLVSIHSSLFLPQLEEVYRLVG